MLRYSVHRLLQLLPTLLGVLALTFLLFDVVGGSPAAIVLGKNASAEALADYDRRHGHDLPLLFGRYAKVPGVTDGIASWDNQDGSAVIRTPYNLFPGSYRLQVEWKGKRPATELTAALLTLTAAGQTRHEQVEIKQGGKGFSIEFAVPEEARMEKLSLQCGAAWPAPYKISFRRKLDNPFNSQFINYLLRLLRGDLGESITHHMPVAQVLREGVGVSLSLTVPILIVGTLAAMFLGLLCAATRGGWFDRGILAVTTALMSINYVIWVVAGQSLLAYRWRLFPLWGYESWFYLVLPVLIGVISGLGRDVRYFRTVMLDEAHRQHVRTAMAKGLSPAKILVRHILRNSMVPVITHLSLAIPFLFTGSILLESFFGLPGIGGVGLNALHSSDVPTLRAVVLIGALLYQAANLLADLAYAWLDPRVRVTA